MLFACKNRLAISPISAQIVTYKNETFCNKNYMEDDTLVGVYIINKTGEIQSVFCSKQEYIRDSFFYINNTVDDFLDTNNIIYYKLIGEDIYLGYKKDSVLSRIQYFQFLDSSFQTLEFSFYNIGNTYIKFYSVSTNGKKTYKEEFYHKIPPPNYKSNINIKPYSIILRDTTGAILQIINYEREDNNFCVVPKNNEDTCAMYSILNKVNSYKIKIREK
jgi:hypothetical protein